MLIVAPVVALSCTANPSPHTTPQEIQVLSTKKLYPIALESAQEELGDVALLWAHVYVAPIQRAAFAFLSVENPRESILVSIGPGMDGPDITTDRSSIPGYLGTIRREDWESIDSGQAFRIAYEAQGRAMVEKYGRTGIWSVILNFVDVGDGPTAARGLDLPTVIPGCGCRPTNRRSVLSDVGDPDKRSRVDTPRRALMTCALPLGNASSMPRRAPAALLFV
jgi:hypothetical protein